ncbi:M20 family metallopeptidase [Paracoccus sp. (in: a-proteobacteria)]|uniref:M20 family metallopeptidase n=1 Tax=Paracoccus sp. TaxID=267 RepID=UPI0028A19103|nr:M20 family metallopeptidase [Paracoccus sp. (in: a-proteobacteria)]
MKNEETIWSMVDRHAPDLVGLSDRVWGMPEICYTEYRSVAEHIAMLNDKGFRVSENVAGIPTAVMGEAGEGGPIIAFLGEYDALPGLSQEAGIAEPRPLAGNGQGHGCGHNLLGSAALLAACALKDWLEETGTPGRVRYYGCPAEEGGAAKSFMAREGAFDGVAAAITWHPHCFNEVAPAASLANTRMDFAFSGRASHAAATPHLGRSALDAAQLMCTGVQYLREHVPQESRIHYAFLDAGGVAPNVVQAKATLRFAIRSTSLSGMFELNERVQRIAHGATMMTDTSVSISIMSAVSNLLANAPLEAAMQANFERLGPPVWDDADRAFAAEIQDTLAEGDIDNAYLAVGLPRRENTPLCDFIVPRDTKRDPMIGSTDVGDVSWIVPTVQAHVATIAIGTPGHSWQVTAQGKMPAAHKSIAYAAKVMAGTAQDCLTNPELLAQARADLDARLAVSPYICPIPADVTPPLQPRPL